MKRNDFYQSILAGILSGLIVGISSIIISSCVYSNELCKLRNVMNQTWILIFFTIGLFVCMLIVFLLLDKLTDKWERRTLKLK